MIVLVLGGTGVVQTLILTETMRRQGQCLHKNGKKDVLRKRQQKKGGDLTWSRVSVLKSDMVHVGTGVVQMLILTETMQLQVQSHHTMADRDGQVEEDIETYCNKCQ